MIFFNAGMHVANLHIRAKAFTNDPITLESASFKKTLTGSLRFRKSGTSTVVSRLGVC